MTSEVSWQVELAVKPGKLDNFRALTREMVESTKDEPGVLLYERFAGDDGKIIYVYERYTDSSSAVSHLLAFGKKYSERFMNMVERKRFMVFGFPSDELKAILDQFDATYHTPFEGFSMITAGVEE
ncbi:MAG: antibiotic biosynthesis monooxygenase [Proteobacteria bacterium]|nr:antibiotic biosynthesis monooxygenase [Pseudomonadota bacterium]